MNTLRLSAILFSAILLTALAPAQAQSLFGRNTIGTTPSGGLRADFKRGSKFVLPEKGLVSSICAYLDGHAGGAGVQTARLALYRDRNGVPAEKLLEAGEDIRVVPSDSPSWYCSYPGGPPLEAGTYWLVIHSSGNSSGIRYYYDGPANWYGNADAYADGAANPFGAGGPGEGTLSIFAYYLTDSEVRVAGIVTPGTRVSSPTAAHTKRGSSIVLAEGGMLSGINAYVDGLGGTLGSQPLWVALYDDLNGEPGSLVARGLVSPEAVSAGRNARWVAGALEGNRVLVPGRYWISLYTGAPAGVFRYYLDGTGNWRSSANPGDEPSPTFGKASVGDGSISAHVVYQPEITRHHTFGVTTPGNIPSKGLSADYVRGSLLFPDHYFQEAWVTALWAYMDGNGGASGSQKVRLALYKMQNNYLHPGGENQMDLIVQSEEVTIPAGKAPGWVRFAIPHKYIFYSHYDHGKGDFQFMLFSGGTPGVARYYYSNAANNWHGAPVAYSAGAPGSMYVNQAPAGGMLLAPGNGTISAYAEYVNFDWTDWEP